MRLDRGVEQLLQEAQVSWSVVRRKRHYQLLVDGEVVLTMSYKFDKGGRVADNARAAVRRFLRQREESTRC
jgi:hypothetical protein